MNDDALINVSIHKLAEKWMKQMENFPGRINEAQAAIESGEYRLSTVLLKQMVGRPRRYIYRMVMINTNMLRLIKILRRDFSY